MSGTSIEPLQIDTIVQEKRAFRVPAYQRGYRWTPQMVHELLDDIKDWSQRGGGGDSYNGDGTDQSNPGAEAAKKASYSLQPVIVRPLGAKNGGANRSPYELVDGQQRLTTILLILALTDGGRFQIKYDTRDETNAFVDQFLSHIDKKTSLVLCDGITLDGEDERSWSGAHPGKTIDIHHLCKAVRAIETWLKQNQGMSKRISEELRRAEVLWYEIDGEDPRTVFARINSGRIPLTDAELIKATLLSREKLRVDDGQDLSRDVVASDWDLIEGRLTDDAFWAFLGWDLGDRHNRIEKLLEIVVSAEDETGQGLRPGVTTHRLFRRYTDERDPGSLSLGERWDETLKLFRAMVEWYEDDAFYHRVGYLRRFKEAEAAQIWDQYRNRTKTAFRDWLDERIAEVVRKPAQTTTGEYDLDKIEYGSTTPKGIEKVLLLFNLPIEPRVSGDGTEDTSGDKFTRNGAYRYPFHRHIEEKWSVEHIQAQNEREIKTPKELEAYVETALETVNAAIKNGGAEDGEEGSDPKEIRKYLKALQAQLPEDSPGGDKRIPGELKQKADTIKSRLANFLELHQLENLTLLSGPLNSSLNNGLFMEKREVVIRQDRTGAFIPRETRNVFLKYYTPSPGTLVFWSQEDRKRYREEMNKRLNKWLNFGRKENGHGQHS